MFLINQTFYCWAQDAAASVTSRIIESHSAVPEVKVCTAALRLMLQTLNWDFRYSMNMAKGTKPSMDAFNDGVRQDIGSPKRSECVLVQVTNLPLIS